MPVDKLAWHLKKHVLDDVDPDYQKCLDYAKFIKYYQIMDLIQKGGSTKKKKWSIYLLKFHLKKLGWEAEDSYRIHLDRRSCFVEFNKMNNKNEWVFNKHL